MKYIKVILISLFFVFSSNLTFSQETSKNVILSISPQYLFIDALRFDVEYNLKNKRHWIGVAPQWYYSNDNSTFFDRMYEVDAFYDYSDISYDTISGFGIEAYHKMFLIEKDEPVGFYFSYGITYQNFNIKYQTYDWETVTIDELEYIEYTSMNKTHTISKLGGNIIIGGQFELAKYMYVDVYIGLGMRYSSHKEDDIDISDFSTNSLDFGYSGPLTLLGVKLAVKL